MATNANGATRQQVGEPLSELIRSLRAENNLSQQRVAELAGCSVSTVRLVEGGWVPSAAMAEKLAAAVLAKDGPEQVGHGS